MRRQKHRSRPQPKAGAPIEVTVKSIGHRGDGLADGPSGLLYVPHTVPGETVRGRPLGERLTEIEVLAPGPARIAPPCPYFGRCGGCNLQHIEQDLYLTFKRDLIVTALKQRSFQNVTVAEPISAPPASRRRAVLKAKRQGKEIQLGFHAARSTTLVAIESCHILTPALEAVLQPLKAILGDLLPNGGTADVFVLDSDSGIDVDIRDCAVTLDLAHRESVQIRADAFDIARLSWSGEPVVERRRPELRFGPARVHPAPSVFVQASREGERILTETVTRHLAGCTRVADLFAGIGTFTFPLAEHSAVTACELDSAAIDALSQAANQCQGLRPINTDRRDLFRRPLTVKELKHMDGAVFDPPRAGAADQAAALAESDVSRVAAVSCNPATFARDARILADGGFTLRTVVPVDQFVWSAHIECVGLFER